MPQPITVQSPGGTNPGVTVASIDASGNEVLSGNATVAGALYLQANATAPVQQPGQVALYSPDGKSVSYVGAGGQAVSQTVSGLTVTGNAKITGTLEVDSQTSMIGATTGSTSLSVSTSGDTNGRLSVTSGGVVNLGPGNAGPDTNFYRGAASLLQTDSSFGTTTTTTKALNASGVGGGVSIKEGTNARMGTAVLVAGAATVANTSVTANTRVFLTSQVDGGTPGFLRVSTRTAGTSFTITSSSNTDTSTVAYLLVEPN